MSSNQNLTDSIKQSQKEVYRKSLPTSKWSSRSAENYKKIDQVGEGTFGKVYKAQLEDPNDLLNHKIFALKKILKQKKTKEINQRHTAEKEHLKIDEFSDMNNLKFFWDQKLEELKSRSLTALDKAS